MNQAFKNNMDIAITKQAKRIIENDEIRTKLEKRMYKLLVMNQCIHIWEVENDNKHAITYQCRKCKATHIEY